MDRPDTDSFVSSASTHDIDGNIDIENPAQLIESPIQDQKVENFDCQVEFSTPVLSMGEAQIKILEELKKAAKTLPPGESPESICGRVRAILVPYWKQSGWLSIGWRATGITVERWKVNCSRCNGRGRVGRGKDNKSCPSCYGSGKEKRSKDIKTPEKGITTAEISTEFVANFNGDIKFKLAPTINVEHIPLTATQLREFTCIPPRNFHRKSQLEVFQQKLKDQWDSNVKNTLSGYERVEGITPDWDSCQTRSDISTYLYPAYVCWYKQGTKCRYIVCDALTGQVTLPSKFGYYAKKAFKFIFKSALVLTAALVVLGVMLESSGKTDKPTPPQSSNVQQEHATATVQLNVLEAPKLAVSKPKFDSTIVQQNWRDGVVAVNEAYEIQLGKFAELPDAQAKARADKVRYERANEQRCGTIPQQLIDGFDTLPMPSLDEKAISILMCHNEADKKRLRTLLAE